MKPKCTLWPSGEVLELNSEETLLQQLKQSGKKIKSSCGGCATCSDCVVIVQSGEANLSPQTFEELRLLGNVFHITRERLSCQTKVLGDVTIDISVHEKNRSSGKEAEKTVPKSTTIIRKRKEEVEKAARESEEKAQVKKDQDWYRHWEKDEAGEGVAKKLGGNRRPKPFRFSDPDGDKES